MCVCVAYAWWFGPKDNETFFLIISLTLNKLLNSEMELVKVFLSIPCTKKT